MGKSGGNGGFKVGSALSDVKIRGETILDKVSKKRREVKDAVGDVPGIGDNVPLTVKSCTFEHHGGVGVISNGLDEPQNRGCGVKQSAETRRAAGESEIRDEFSDRLPSKCRPEGFDDVTPKGLKAHHGSHPARFPDGLIPAGKGDLL